MKLKSIITTIFVIIASIVSFFISEFDIKKDDEVIPKGTKLNEKFYQERFCKKLNGLIEYRLPDATRIDCLTKEYAIEVDFAKKWAEGIGQGLYYGIETNRKPAVALIVGKKDEKFLKRIRKVAKEFNIKIFIIDKIEQ